jgi:hypothetical protein
VINQARGPTENVLKKAGITYEKQDVISSVNKIARIK